MISRKSGDNTCTIFFKAIIYYFSRESSRKSGDLMRSRTRENNVYVEEEQ